MDFCHEFWFLSKHLNNILGQKLLDSAKKSTADARKTASKRAIQKTAEETGDLIGNKVNDEITNTSKKSLSRSQNDDANSEIKEPKKKIHISRRKTTNYWWIKVSITI